MGIDWQRNTERPEDKKLCLIVLNGKIIPDVLIYHHTTDTFRMWTLVAKAYSELKIARAEVEAWIAKNQIPLPTWVIPRTEV